MPPKQYDPVLVHSSLTDTGNAECLVALHGDELRHCRHTQQWFRWDGVRWRPDAWPEAVRMQIGIARARQEAADSEPDPGPIQRWGRQSESYSKVRAALELAANLEPITALIEQFDTNAWLLATQIAPHGGAVYLDLIRSQPRTPAAEDRVTMQIGTYYDPQAQCPRWLQFLDEVFAGDQSVVAYIQRVVGYLLTGDMREQKLWILHGSGANGKSVLLDVISQLLGDYAATAAFSTFDADRKSTNTNDLANLRGRRFIAISEVNEARSLDEARVKAVTGFRDKIRCRQLYREEFEYTPTYKIWLAVNYLPRIRGSDNGIWRRLAVIPFTQSFLDTGDKDLPNKLTAELPGILNWALEGLREWQRIGLATPDAIIEATQVYRRDSDLLGDFLEECVEADGTSETTAELLYRSYSNWLHDRGERFPPTMTAFGRQMGERGYQKKRTDVNGKKLTVYVGLKLWI